MVELVQETVSLPKEINDVRKLVVELVKDLKAKKDISLIAAENFPLLMSAFDGFDKLGEELKSPAAVKAGALLAGDLAEVFLSKPA